jgi:hypothetical protein
LHSNLKNECRNEKLNCLSSKNHDARLSIRGIIKRNSENLKSVIEKPRHAVLRSASLSIGAGSMWLSPRAKYGLPPEARTGQREKFLPPGLRCGRNTVDEGNACKRGRKVTTAHAQVLQAR